MKIYTVVCEDCNHVFESENYDNCKKCNSDNTEIVSWEDEENE